MSVVVVIIPKSRNFAKISLVFCERQGGLVQMPHIYTILLLLLSCVYSDFIGIVRDGRISGRGNLPYAPSSAMVMCTAHDPVSGTPISPLCTRGLLERVVRAAREECGIGFNVGAEIEFTLVRGGST